MTRVTGPNGAVVLVPDELAKELVGDGGRGYSVVPETKAPARKRAATKTTK